jgi:hypothetical protein
MNQSRDLYVLSTRENDCAPEDGWWIIHIDTLDVLLKVATCSCRVLVDVTP